MISTLPANHFSELLLPAGPAPFIVTGKVKLMTSATSQGLCADDPARDQQRERQAGACERGHGRFRIYRRTDGRGQTAQPSLSWPL